MNTHPRALLRNSIENEIERLFSMLDDMEPDPDLEDNADAEPILGWPNGHGVSQLDKSMAHDDDREADEDPGEDDDPAEPNGDELDHNRGAEDELAPGDSRPDPDARHAAADALRRLRDMKPLPQRDPDEVTIIAPGVARVGY